MGMIRTSSGPTLVPQIHRPPMFLTFFAEREVRNEADRLLQVTRVNQPHRPPKDLVNRRELADEAVRRYKIVNNVYGPKCSIRIILLNSCPEMLLVHELQWQTCCFYEAALRHLFFFSSGAQTTFPGILGQTFGES